MQRCQPGLGISLPYARVRVVITGDLDIDVAQRSLVWPMYRQTPNATASAVSDGRRVWYAIRLKRTQASVGLTPVREVQDEALLVLPAFRYRLWRTQLANNEVRDGDAATAREARPFNNPGLHHRAPCR